MALKAPFIPAWLDDLPLTIYERGLLMHIWRRGELYASLQTISEHLQISKSQVQRALKTLAEKGLIDKHENGLRKPVSYKPKMQSLVVSQTIVLQTTDSSLTDYSTVVSQTTKGTPLKVPPLRLKNKKDSSLRSLSQKNETFDDFEQPLFELEEPASEQKKPDFIEENFNEFWEQYPRYRRGARTDCLKAYRAAIAKTKRETKTTEKEICHEIYRGLLAYNASLTDHTYAKGCKAWLNDSRWLWDYSQQRQQQQQQPIYSHTRTKSGDDYWDTIVAGSLAALGKTSG